MVDRIEISQIRTFDVDIEIYDCGSEQEISYTISKTNFNKLIEDYQKELKPMFRHYATTDALNRLEARVISLETAIKENNQSIENSFKNKNKEIKRLEAKVIALEEYIDNNNILTRLDDLESESKPSTVSVKYGDVCWFYDNNNEGKKDGKVSILTDYDSHMPYPYTDRDLVTWENCISIYDYIKNLNQ